MRRSDPLDRRRNSVAGSDAAQVLQMMVAWHIGVMTCLACAPLSGAYRNGTARPRSVTFGLLTDYDVFRRLCTTADGHECLDGAESE